MDALKIMHILWYKIARMTLRMSSTIGEDSHGLMTLTQSSEKIMEGLCLNTDMAIEVGRKDNNLIMNIALAHLSGWHCERKG